MKQRLMTFLFILFSVSAMSQENEPIKKKFFTTVEIAYGKGLNLYSNAPINTEGFHTPFTKSLRVISGWNFSPHFSTGLGIGADRFENPGANTFPVFIDLRGYLKNQAKTTFAYLNLGKAVTFSEAQEKGNIVDVGFGYRGVLTGKSKLIFKVGYYYFKTTNWILYESKNYYLKRNSLKLAIGVEF